MKKSIYKMLKITIAIMLILLVVGTIVIYGVNKYVESAVVDRVLESDEIGDISADCILVLGAGVTDSGRPKTMLKDRLDIGVKLFNSSVSQRLLMSGDHGTVGYDEVNVMKDFAIDAGIPSEYIFMDHAGFSTYESLYRAKEIFQVKSLIIVTQDYHLYRALYIADKLGLEAYGVPAKSQRYSGQSYRDSREKLARVKDFFYVIFKPEPQYLGPKIPIDTNGDLTND